MALVNKYTQTPVGKVRKAQDKQTSMDSYLNGQLKEVETSTKYEPTVQHLSNNDYRGSKPPQLLRKMMSSSDVRNLVTSNLEKHTTPTKANTGALSPDIFNIEEHIANITFMKYFVADRTHFVNPEAYEPTYEFLDSDYTSVEDDIVSAMASAPRDRYSPFDRKVAKNAIAILNSVRAQSNSHNPFYAMPVSLIYDRLKDYFQAVHRLSVIIANAKILVSKQFTNEIQKGAKRYNEIYGFKYYSDPTNYNKITDAIAIAVSALNGAFCDSKVLSDYLVYNTIGLMPNQNHSFRFTLPFQYDQNGNSGTAVYNGFDLFYLTSSKTEADITALVTTLVSELWVGSAYMRSGAAQLIRAGLQGYNQFDILNMDMQEPKLVVHSEVLLSLENQKIRTAGYYVRDVATAVPFTGYCISCAPDVVNFDDVITGISYARSLHAQPGGLGKLSILTTDPGITNDALYEKYRMDHAAFVTDPTFKARLETALYSNIELKDALDVAGNHTLYYYNTFTKEFGLTRTVGTARAIPYPHNTAAHAIPIAADIAARGVSIDVALTVAEDATQLFFVGDASLIREIDVIFKGQVFIEANLNSSDFSITDDIITASVFVSALGVSSNGSAVIVHYLTKLANKFEASLGIPILIQAAYIVDTTFSGADINLTGLDAEFTLDFNTIGSSSGMSIIEDMLPGFKFETDKIMEFDYAHYQYALKLAYAATID